MNKQQFLTQLRARLWSIPQADANASIDYYAEMIDDRMEEGLSEEEAVAGIGSVEEVARTIIAETPVYPQPPQPAAPQKQRKGLRWWEIVLLVLGSPIWVSLLVAVVAVIFSVWISLWSGVISLYATAVALAASAIGCIIGSFFMIDTGAVLFLTAWGAALVCAGLSILLFILSNLAAKGMVALTKLTLKGFKAIFAGREEAA